MAREEPPFESVVPTLPGDRLLRRRRLTYRRPRSAPITFGPRQALRFLFTKTLLPWSLGALGMGLVGVSLALDLAESGQNPGWTSFGDALWWSLTAMTTLGAGDLTPITAWGRLIGGVWAILGSIAFWVTIIATSLWVVRHGQTPGEPPEPLPSRFPPGKELSPEELEHLKAVIERLIAGRFEGGPERGEPGRGLGPSPRA